MVYDSGAPVAQFLGAIDNLQEFQTAVSTAMPIVTLGRDAERPPIWNQLRQYFAVWPGFEVRPCQPCRVQTKGKVEGLVKYVSGNMWPSVPSPTAPISTRKGRSGATPSPAGQFTKPPFERSGRCLPMSGHPWKTCRPGACWHPISEAIWNLFQEKTRGIYTSSGLALPRVHNGWERQALWPQRLLEQLTNIAMLRRPL